ncbi:Protein translocase subunit SecY [Candidatus Fokinia solitaria]|uniref:Protein translocase subunit SecY n=1 Tax=Candidatus Fokinia solitaria TaxID=1802984 RepID=A0A2U8BRE0_9RICK|nr:preprotein translocase subunit SecY [Candidatus Fokinia solitaria]AWD32914.1 Protein translocase subunit SecY [Candidatus Fokinia solitaria]
MLPILKRVLFVLGALLVYRFGTYVTIPGIDLTVLKKVADDASAKGLLGVFNMFTGGALSRMSIFGLNIMPYITASIVMQLLSAIVPYLSEMKKEGGETGRRKIASYTKYLALLLAFFQAYALVSGAEQISIDNAGIVIKTGFHFRLVGTISMVGGTVFMIWLSDQITKHGIGNGSSMIIFSGILAGLIPSITSLFSMMKVNAISVFSLLCFIFFTAVLLFIIVFFERAYRPIAVTYPRKQIGNKIYSGDSTHIPLKINTSGVLAPIFASSVLIFPSTVINLLSASTNPIVTWLLQNFGYGKPLYIALYLIFIIFFSFFYTSVVFNPADTANNLKKNGAIIPGTRPGEHTARYIESILLKLNVIGAAYISFVCIVPEMLGARYSLPFYLGGTSLLIVVNVSIELFQYIQNYLITLQYSSLIKKGRAVIR